MMRWRVISFFIDLQDGEHPYNVGDAFPREGRTVSEERIKELSTSQNKRKMPLIELVKEPEPVKEPEKEPVKEAKKEKNERSGSSSASKAKPRKKK